MGIRFTTTEIGNVLNSLSDEDALQVVALSLAANDLSLNVKAIGRFTESENTYFFVASLSILRELAKLVAKFDTSSAQGAISGETERLMMELKSSLAPFENESLARSVLKPIRDVTFHYNYLDSNGNTKQLTSNALAELKAQDKLEIGFIGNIDSALEQRYFYADKFRFNILSQLLNKELLSTVTVTSEKVVTLVDSLMTDLKNWQESL